MSDTPAGKGNQQFTWDDSGADPTVFGDGTHYYLYGPNVSSAPIEQLAKGAETASYLTADTTGVRGVLLDGSISGSMSYTSVGVPCTGCSAATPFGFEGGYTDASGLIYFVHRDYDPKTGQFLSVDPAVEITGQPFSYANDD